MARKDRAALLRALKSCIGMCGDQAAGFVAEAQMEEVTEGRHYSAEFALPDGAQVAVYLHVAVRPGAPRKRPLMIEGPKR